MASESPSSTWFGGKVGVPIACRRNDMTMMMRVNEVTETSSALANESAVSKRNSLTAELPPPPSESDKPGSVMGAARKASIGIIESYRKLSKPRDAFRRADDVGDADAELVVDDH